MALGYVHWHAPYRTSLRTLCAVVQIMRSLPWRPAATSKRQTEQVRPIFWSNRPRAYLKRTSDWDSYPAGRWGNAASPAYGEPPSPRNSFSAMLFAVQRQCGRCITLECPCMRCYSFPSDHPEAMALQ